MHKQPLQPPPMHRCFIPFAPMLPPTPPRPALPICSPVCSGTPTVAPPPCPSPLLPPLTSFCHANRPPTAAPSITAPSNRPQRVATSRQSLRTDSGSLTTNSLTWDGAQLPRGGRSEGSADVCENVWETRLIHCQHPHLGGGGPKAGAGSRGSAEVCEKVWGKRLPNCQRPHLGGGPTEKGGRSRGSVVVCESVWETRLAHC